MLLRGTVSPEPAALDQNSQLTIHRGLLQLKNQKPKYQITHPSGKIGEAEDVTLKLHYNVQPWFGPLTWDTEKDYGYWKALSGGFSKKFTLPGVKKKDTKTKKP